MPAIESGSALCAPDEELEKAFLRLQYIEEHMCKIAYISLTWNEENRFGGGALHPAGLKEDGKELLKWMGQRGTPIDLSHASDVLAYDILSFIDEKNLNVPVIASHSNCRAITDVPRNLPDELIKEIIRRDGVIGINFVREFIGRDSIYGFCKHVEHLEKLGGAKHMVLGADFFYGQDKNSSYNRPLEEQYHLEFCNASCYPAVLDLWRRELKWGDEEINRIAYGNAIRFFKKLYEVV